jgi:hypothetical protein
MHDKPKPKNARTTHASCCKQLLAAHRMPLATAAMQQIREHMIQSENNPNRPAAPLAETDSM